MFTPIRTYPTIYVFLALVGLALGGCSTGATSIPLSTLLDAPVEPDMTGARISWPEGFEIAPSNLGPDSLRNALSAEFGPTDEWYVLRPATHDDPVTRTWFLDYMIPGMVHFDPGLVLADGTTVGGGMRVGSPEVIRKRIYEGFIYPDSVLILDGGLACYVTVTLGGDELFCRRPDLDDVDVDVESRPFIHPGYALMRDSFWLWIDADVSTHAAFQGASNESPTKASIFDEPAQTGSGGSRQADPTPAADEFVPDCAHLDEWPESKQAKPKRTKIFSEAPPKPSDVLSRVEPALVASGALCMALNGDIEEAIRALESATTSLSPLHHSVYWITAENYFTLTALYLASEDLESAQKAATLCGFFSHEEIPFYKLGELPAPDGTSLMDEFRRVNHDTLSRMVESFESADGHERAS